MTTSTGTRLTDSTTDAELDALAAAGALPVVGEPEGGGEIADEDSAAPTPPGRAPRPAGRSACPSAPTPRSTTTPPLTA